VSLLREGGVPEKESEQIQLAKLSLLASKKACNQSAFESAGRYAAIGVGALPTNRWSEHYELTLDLYSTAAEIEVFLGNIDLLEELYKEVLDQKDRPLFDKLRVYHAVISYMLGALGKQNNAIEAIEELLAQFGIKFPKRKGTRSVSTISGFMKAKRRMSSLRPEDISNLPMMKDPTHLETMRLLDQLFIATYMSASDLMPLTIFARVRLTLEYGLSQYSAHTFACMALLLRDDPALASKVGSFARVVMTIIDCKNMYAKVEVWLSALVFCWTDPIARMMPRVLRAYEIGLSVGDNENACWVSVAVHHTSCVL
jgi:predicted ATPase